MSVARLLISGLLVASGLVLAAFTLHGAFDARQVHASGPPLKPWSTDTIGAGGRRVTQQGQPKTTAGTAPKADVAPSGATADAKAAAAKARRKRLAEKQAAEKKLAEEAKAKQQPQQTALQWPWNWFSQ
jgi:hypothetical protein